MLVAEIASAHNVSERTTSVPTHLVEFTSCLTEAFVTCRMAARPLMCTQGQKQQAQSEGARLGVTLNKVKHQGSAIKRPSVVRELLMQSD